MKILVVEDDIDQNELLCRVLTAEGYAVTTVLDGYEAVLKINGERFDLIVSDVNLGASPSGFDVFKALQGVGGGDFILYSSSGYERLGTLAEDLGILKFISNSKVNFMDIKQAVVDRLNDSVRRNTEATNKLLGLE